MKTLKELEPDCSIETNDEDAFDRGWNSFMRVSRANAIAWLKHFDEMKYNEYVRLDNGMSIEVRKCLINWIMYFFNITEEDLK